MRFIIVSFVAVLCLVNSVYGGDHHHVSSSARHSTPSKNTHSHYHSHSYTYSYSYTHSHSHSHSHSYSHSHSASYSRTYATHAPIVIHGHQIEKRNIIDFFKRLINPVSTSANINASPSTSVSISAVLSSTPAAVASVSQLSSDTKKVFKNTFAMLQDDSHASAGLADPAFPLSAIAPVPHAVPSHAFVSSRHVRGNRRKNVSLLSSLSSKASSKASAYASASAPVSPRILSSSF